MRASPDRSSVRFTSSNGAASTRSGQGASSIAALGTNYRQPIAKGYRRSLSPSWSCCSHCVIDGPIDGASFLAYVEQVLVPTLQPGDIVVIVTAR
jgi:hypothetical protein